MAHRTERKKPSAGKIILGILAGLIGAILLTYCILMFLIPALEKPDMTPVDGSADWMSRLDDGLFLSEVVLPGTHDSASYHPQLAFFSQCQSATVEDQLNAGFRFLDIRLERVGDTMKLMHGFTACKSDWWPFASQLELPDILNQCYRFLDAHPTETILFSVKLEHGDGDKAAFQTALQTILSKNPSYWLETDHIPTVGEARGKMILLRRFSDSNSLGTAGGVPFVWNEHAYALDLSAASYETDNDFYTLWVQDRYKFDAPEKWDAFLEGMRAGKTGPNDLSINYLSTNGSPAYGHPYRYAKDLNARLPLLETELKGWVIVDFGTPALASLIYSHNF